MAGLSLSSAMTPGLSPRGGSGGGGALLPYLGNVATKVRIPSNISTTNRQFNSRSHHFARDNISVIGVKLPNWYWARKNTLLEVNGTGTITYEAAIEYPAGTFTRLTFSGSNSGVVLAGGDIVSDQVVVSIPKDAQFWVRTFATGTANIVFTDGDLSPASDQVDDINGEAMEFAASGLSSKVMGGTISASVTTTAAPIFTPTAIIAMTSQPTVYILGDSRAWGYLDVFGVAGDTDGDKGELAKSIGPYYGYINAGSAGDRWGLRNTSSAHRNDLIQYCSHGVVQIAINDLRSGGSGQSRTGASVMADAVSFANSYSGVKWFLTTTAPVSASTDVWATLGNQTTNANAAQIAAYNDLVRTKPTPFIGYFEVADAVESSRNSGLWKSPGFTADGLHESSAIGYKAIKDSGAINPSAFGSIPPAVTPVIFDTDYDSDIDDVSALALLLGYVAAGNASLLAATVASNNDYAAGALRGSLNAAGFSSVPVGAYKGTAIGGGSSSTYAQTIATFFRPSGEVRTAYTDAITVLRTALAARVGNPVKTKIIIAGTCTNIAVLLASSGDGISPLNGSDLIAATVSSIHVMGGNFSSPTTIENNIAFDVAAANTVASSSPVPVYWSHYQAGNDVFTGVTDRALAADVIPADPYGEAWTLGASLHTAGKRQSWDLIAVYDAIFGTSTGLLSYGSLGDASFSATSPYCAFSANPSGKSRVVDKTVSASAMAAAMQPVIDGFIAGVPLLESNFTLPFWTPQTGSTITANQYADAAGQMIADVYNEGTAAAVHSMYSINVAITSGVRYRIEMDVRAIDAPFAQIVIGNSAFGTGNFANINLSTNAFASTSLSGGTPTTQVTDMGGGIWRYAIEMTATLTNTSNISFGHVPAGNSARNLSWTGTGKTSAISRFKWFSV